MPGSEHDQPFFRALVDLWNDPATYRWRGRILGGTVVQTLGWPHDGAQIVNIARRLEDRGLVELVEMNGDVAIRLKTSAPVVWTGD
jgi:hypothetical protein